MIVCYDKKHEKDKNKSWGNGCLRMEEDLYGFQMINLKQKSAMTHLHSPAMMLVSGWSKAFKYIR